MKSATYSRKWMCHLLGAGALFLAFAFAVSAQVQTSTKTTSGAATTNVQVERGTIVYVSGNNVVVKKDDGTILHFNNVPDTTTVTVDGKQLNVHQLQVGMKVERQTITTTTPEVITTVKTVTGTVWQVSPPSSVILTMPNGKNQRFKIPDGQKFDIGGGQMADAWSLRQGMKINAQQVTETPQTVVDQQVKRTGVAPPPPPPPPAPDVPILIVMVPVRAAAPAPVETAAAAPEPAPKALPKTGSDFPLLGLLGALSIAVGLGLKAARTRNA